MSTSTATVPVCVVVRVSTSKQETSRQVHDLEAVAKHSGWQVVEVCHETISGIAGLEERPRLMRALEGGGGSLYWHAHSIEMLLPGGKRIPAAAIMLALLAEMARAAKDTLRERIMSGLADARRKGSTLGRPKGSTVSTADFLARHKDIQRLLKAGQSVRNAAKISGKGGSTVQRVKAAMPA